MQPAFSPDRVFTKSESVSMRRAPLAVISFADNKPTHTPTESSGILCKRIDNSAHFVDLTIQAQPTKKFTPLAIPLETMKKKPLTSSVPNRVLMTEPNDYNPSSTVLDTQHLQTESSESHRNLNKKRVQKHYTSVSSSIKAQPKKKTKESVEKKEPEVKMTGVKRKVPTSKDSLRSSQAFEKKQPESFKPIKSKSPKNIKHRLIPTENVPPQTTVTKKTEKRSKPRLVRKEKPQASLVKKSVDIKTSKQSLASSLRHPLYTEQVTEKSPPRETAELERFVQYNAMRILWELKEQKKQEEFERRLNEERKIALEEGNKRIREANFLRFNFQHKLNPKQRLAWGADQRKFTRQARSPSAKKAQKPKINDEDRRKVLGLDHVDEAKLERFREKVRMTLNQDSFEQLEEQIKPKKHMTEDEYEDLHRYMIEKKIKMEEEWNHKKREEYHDFERKRKNLERLFTEIRESRVQVPKPKKKGKKRTKKRRSEKHEDGSRAQQMATEPNDMRLGTQESDDENYSLLYDEYKKIIKSKTTPKGEPSQQKGSSHGKQVLAPIQQNLYEQDEFEQKKKEYKKKYDEISNRYQKNLANNMQMQENKLSSRQLRQDLEYQEEQEEEYSDQQNLQDNLPANSAREIIEAAAIFIQKNYRGYRTRKILREYISRLYREYQEELEAQGGEYYEEGEEEEEERDEQEEEEEEEDLDEEQRAYLQERHRQQYEEEEDQEVEEEEGLEQEEEGEYEKEENLEEGEEEEGEHVEIEDEDNYEFLGDDEKQSLRSLLEKQKLGLHEEYNNTYNQNEEEDEEEVEPEQAGAGGNFVERYRQIKDQYQVLYDQEDLRGGGEEDEGVRNQSDLDVDQDIIDINEEGAERDEREIEKEGSEYFTAPPPRMAKSDGEIIENYQFDLDEESQAVMQDNGLEYMQDEEASEDGDNQISLHGDGEDDYEVALKDKNMRFNFEHGGAVEKREERGSTKQQEPQHRQEENPEEGEYEEGREEYEEDYPEEGEYEEGEGEDQERYDPRYDPQYQKGYLQGYQGNFQRGEEDLGEYEEEEEGYIHESDYEAGFDQNQDQDQEYEQEQMQYRKRYSEGDIRHGHRPQVESEELEEQEGYPDQRHEGEGSEEKYEQEPHEEDQTPEDEYELEQYHEEEEGFLNQQHIRHSEGAGDEKLVVISTINSEEDVDARHSHDAPNNQKSRRHPQRRNKSDVNPEEEESQHQSHHSHKESEEERKSQISKSGEYEELEEKEEGEEYYSEEKGEVEEHIEEEIPESGNRVDYGTDSDHFREELIEELKQNQSKDRVERYRYAEQQEDELHEEEDGENEEDFFRRAGSLKEPGPQQEEEKIQENERPSEKGKHLSQKSGEFTEQYQAELNKLREEQATKWDQMVESLSLLTSQGEVQFNQNIKDFIETLQKQSEINKIALTSDIEEVQIPEGQATPENKIDPDLARMGFQGAQGTRTLDISKIPPALKKKLDVISPRQESKYLKKQKPFGYPKKNNLHIDVNVANEDSHETESAGLNLDLSQMRLVLGSEQLLREQSARTLSHSASAPSDGDSVDFHAFENAEGSIFERDPFKEFTRRKFKELMEQENMKNLIKMREQALEIRHKTQLDEMKKALENRRVSPRTFQHKQIELEKWITRERDLIQKTKKDIERGWQSTADSIQRTQRDLQFLQKALAGAEGRNTNTSEEISLRHSFTDEDAGEHAETQSERLSKRSLFNIANELRSPSPSKNIKIIDKFELKDHLFSPQLNNSMGSKKDHVEELRAEFEGKDLEEKRAEAAGSPLNLREEDLSKRHLLESKDSQPSTGRKAVDYQMDSVRALSQGEYSHTQEEDNLQALTSEEMRSAEKPQTRPAKVQVHEKKELQRKDSPLETDKEIYPDELIDEEIEWENEVVQSPRIFEEGNENKEYTPGRSMNARSPLHPVEHAAGVAYSPKSQEDLRYMFQEKMKQMQIYQSDYVVEGEGEQGEAEIEGEEHPQHAEEIDAENIQTKTDLICGEILEDLFEELGFELLSPGKERILDKIVLLGEEPPVQANLHNLIENNYFFHAGVEHPNFQANIAMPHLMSPEHYKHQHEKKENELTPEQQRQMQLAEMQTEMLRTLGIRTEIPYVSRYLELLIQEIQGPYKENFLRNMNTPLGFSPFEKLTNMRNYGLGATESSLAAGSSESQLVLEVQLYAVLEGRIMEEFPERNEVSTELEHIHNRMIFDCCNDILNFFRPFGLNGVPYPWKAGSKALKTQKVTEENMDQVLEKLQTKIIDWASYLCGYFGENDEFIHDKSQSFTDEYLAQVREERILRMLSEEIFEMENKWICYDEEEAEVELEISDLVFDHMVTETAELIAQIFEQRRDHSSNWMST